MSQQTTFDKMQDAIVLFDTCHIFFVPTGSKVRDNMKAAEMGERKRELEREMIAAIIGHHEACKESAKNAYSLDHFFQDPMAQLSDILPPPQAIKMNNTTYSNASSIPKPDAYDQYGNLIRDNQDGLTKREYFASQIFSGIMSDGERVAETHLLIYASHAVALADALIEALNQPPKTEQ